MENTQKNYRLENEKRIYMIKYADGSNEYDIVSGSKAGVCIKERRTCLSGTQGRTPEQEAQTIVAKLLAAKMKSGYEMVQNEKKTNSDPAEMIAKVESGKATATEIAHLNTAIKAAKKSCQKAKKAYEAKKADLDSLKKALEIIRNKA